MEAQLIDTPFDPCLLPGPQRPRPEHPVLAARLERYLRAAGMQNAPRRERLVAECLEELSAEGRDADVSSAEPSWAEPSWAEIIAAVDRCLTRQLEQDGRSAVRQSARGRVSLGLGPAQPAMPAEDWATPPRDRRAMPAQDLSRWHPGTAWRAKRLQRVQFSRSTQGLAACICWLAVLVFP